jgi:hypothetical protein
MGRMWRSIKGKFLGRSFWVQRNTPILILKMKPTSCFSNRCRMVFSLIPLILMGFCSTEHSNDKAIENVQETVFRYQFGRPADFYCIALFNEQDPSDEFMQRFINNNPPVKKYSECRIGTETRLYDLRDSVSGKPPIFFSIRSVSLKMWKKAEVHANWSRGPVFGEAHRYLLRYDNGKWKVIEDKIISVS